MVIRDLRECNLFIAFTALLVVLVLVLTKLTATVGAKTVKMTTVG